MLEERVDACLAAGVPRGKIMVDPGLGFGKSLGDNLALVNGLATFQGLGVPLLFAGSRKRLIGALSNEADRKSVVSGKSGSVRVDIGGRRILKTKKTTN